MTSDTLIHTTAVVISSSTTTTKKSSNNNLTEKVPTTSTTDNSPRRDDAEDMEMDNMDCQPDNNDHHHSRSSSTASFLQAKRLSLTIACSYKGKMQVQDPYETTAVRSGEDAMFISPSNNCMGVFDGVGGWAALGVDPSLVSSKLMYGSRDAVDRLGYREPRQILTHAYNELVRDQRIRAGSSTACIVCLGNTTTTTTATDSQQQHSSDEFEQEEDVEEVDDERQSVSSSTTTENQHHPQRVCAELKYANLGDSGFIVVRPPCAQNDYRYSIVYRNPLQHHGEGLLSNPPPFQLAVVPPEYKSLGACEDKPEDADCRSVLVQENDIVILASDGLFDNLTESEILDVVGFQLKEADHLTGSKKGSPVTLQMTAKRLAQMLVSRAFSSWRKPDDITVGIAIVNPTETIATN